MLVNVDTVNLLKNNVSNFVIFVILGAPIFSRWVVVAFIFFVPGLIQEWGTQRQFKISSFCFWCGSREWRFYVQEVGFKIFLPGPRDEKILLRSFASCKKKNLHWKWGVGVCGICYHRQIFFDFVILSWGKQWEVLIVAISKCCLRWCRLVQLNCGAQVEHFTHQLSFVYAWLLHKCLPCLPSRWVSPYASCPIMIGLMVVLLTFFAWGV